MFHKEFIKMRVTRLLTFSYSHKLPNNASFHDTTTQIQVLEWYLAAKEFVTQNELVQYGITDLIGILCEPGMDQRQLSKYYHCYTWNQFFQWLFSIYYVSPLIIEALEQKKKKKKIIKSKIEIT